MEKSMDELITELRESTAGWQGALNELQQVMLDRGFITLEGLEAARRESCP